MPSRRIFALAVLLGLLASSVAFRAAEAGTSSSPERALSKLAEASTRTLVARSDPGESVPSFVTGRIPVAEFSSSAGAAQRGWDFWNAYGRAFGVADPRAELALRSIERDDLGMTHLTYDQRHRGLPVFGRQMLLHLDGDAVTVVNGELTPGIGLSTTPAVSAARAREAAEDTVPARALLAGGPPPELLVHVDRAERARLAWRVTVASSRPLGLWQVFVGARTGTAITFYNDLHTAKNRTIYTNNNDPDCNTMDAPQCILPGTLMRSEGGAATGDAVIDDNYSHTGTTYDYYSGTFTRDSYDGAGHTIRSTVHFGSGYNNAFWCDDVCAAFFGSPPDGEQIVFGDGDGVVFSSLARDVDVVSHELTHGVTSSEANLTYQGQSGALNESYSDVFAAMVDTGDWLIGEDSFTPGTPGDALRNMADPSAEGQPEHMSEYEETVYDAGGVHGNSGIPNHAAYLTSEGPGYGIGRPATQQIYYRALTTYLTPSSDFQDNLNALLQAADELFAGTAEMTAVARANAAVGIVNPPAVTFPNGGESIAAGSGTTVTWTTDDNARPFKVSYLQDMGSTTYAQGFEGGATLPGEFTTGGNAPWSVSTVDPAPGGGIRNARSGVIPNNGRSELSLNVRLAASGSVSFKYRVSSEPNFDFLSFYVDGEEMFAASGAIPWSTNSESLSAGTHTLTWVYEKDFIVIGGSDLARIDDISISNAENVALTTINATTVAGATSQPWTTPTTGGSNFKVRVETLGVAPWYSTDDSNAMFSITGGLPDTTIIDGPSGPTNDSTPTFTFTSTEPGSTFECKVDADPFASCTSPHTTSTLVDGPHTFEVRATVNAMTDPSPDSRLFTVDTVPPETTITAGPSGPTDDSTPTFDFISDETGSTFACRVDANPFASCTTPHTTAALPDGAHTFEVRAIDPAANTDPTPDSRSFTVTLPPPPVVQPTLSIGNAKKKEPDRGKKMMKFKVSLSEAATSPVTVNFATKNGSARTPKDFKAVNGTLTFAPGTTVQVIKVAVKGDLLDERNEKFSVLLSAPSGATIADGTAMGKILDND